MPVIFDSGDAPISLNDLLPLSSGEARYVDLENGNNHNVGSAASPWRTVQPYGGGVDEFGGRSFPVLPGSKFFVSGTETQVEAVLSDATGSSGLATNPITVERWPGRPSPVWETEFLLGDEDGSSRSPGGYRLVGLTFGSEDTGDRLMIACSDVDVLDCRFLHPGVDHIEVRPPAERVTVAGCLFAPSAYGDGSECQCILVLRQGEAFNGGGVDSEDETPEDAVPSDISIYNNVCVGPAREFVGLSIADRYAVVFNSVHKVGTVEAVRLGPRVLPPGPGGGGPLPQEECLILWHKLEEDAGADLIDSSAYSRTGEVAPGEMGAVTRAVGSITLAPAAVMPRWGSSDAWLVSESRVMHPLVLNYQNISWPWRDLRPGFPVACDDTMPGDRSWTILLDYDWNTDPGPDDLSPPGGGLTDYYGGGGNLRGIWGFSDIGTAERRFGFGMWHDMDDDHTYFGITQPVCAAWPWQRWIVDGLTGAMSFHYNEATAELTVCADGVPVVGPVEVVGPSLWGAYQLQIGAVDMRLPFTFEPFPTGTPPDGERGGWTLSNGEFRGVAIWECYLTPEELVGVRPGVGVAP